MELLFYRSKTFQKLKKAVKNERIQKQVLTARPVLKRCILALYVPLTVLCSANVPALNRSFFTAY